MLVSTMHVAEQGYFVSLQQHISAATGYRILYEMVGKLSPEEKALLTEAEEEVLKELEQIKWVTALLCEITGLQPQQLGVLPSWVNTDMTAYALIRRMAEERVHLFRKNSRLATLALSDRDRMSINFFIRALLSWIIPLLLLMRLTTCGKRRSMLRIIIVQERDAIAFKGITEHALAADVISIWGAEHISGIHRMLKRAGYKKTRREWFTALRVQKGALRGFLCALKDTSGAIYASTGEPQQAKLC